MRILHLISSYGFFGAERVVLELAKEFYNSPIECFIGVFLNRYNPHTELTNYAREAGLPVFNFPCNGKFDITTLRQIKQFLRHNRIDVIHGHGYKSNIYAYFARGGHDIQLVSTCHNWIAMDKKTRLYYLLEKLLLRRFNGIIAVSQEVLKAVRSVYPRSERIYLIENGINPDSFSKGLSVRSAFGIRDTDIMIGTVGRLSEEKGIDILIEVARKVCEDYENVFFVIVGDGPLKNELMRLRDSYGLTKNVFFTGARKDVENINCSLDLYLLTSRTEGTPMAMLEAMAAGVPVVASRVGGISKIIEDQKQGILVTSGHIQGFYEAIIDLVNNRTKAEIIGHNGHLKVKQQYSSRKMADRYIAVYNNILKPSGKAFE